MQDLDALAVLQEPLRRQLYDYVVAQDHDVSRSEAAEATGEQRTLVAFHLDKLVEVGLLDTTSRRLTGRSGPGAGRPAKLYRRAAGERQVSLPPRDYRMAAELLAAAADEARLDTELQDAARCRGAALRQAGSSDSAVPNTLEAAIEVLARQGYEPVVDESGPSPVVRMRNCPFHTLSEAYPALVCGMNLAFLEGLLGGEGTDFTVRLDPRAQMCCTTLISKNNSS